MTKPLVSVVIPNYNYAQYVGEAIDSALNQDYPNLEVLVINNGSTDNSIEVLEGYRKRFSDRFRFVTQGNMGQAGARNRGVLESRGEFIAFLDADDVWVPEKISQQMALFERPEVGIVYSGYEEVDRDLKPLRTIQAKYTGHVHRAFADGVQAVVLAGESTSIIRRECFAKVGIFDTSLSNSSGWDMFRRISAFYEVDAIKAPLMKYRQHGANRHGLLKIYRKEILLRTEKMFKDPDSSKIANERRGAFSRVYWALSGAHLKAGQYLEGTWYLLKSLTNSPVVPVKRLLSRTRQA